MARWAESNGHQHNRPRPHAWRYRDYVIDAVKRKQGHPEPIYLTPKSVVGGMRPDERKRFNALEAQIAEFPQTWGYYSPVTATRRRPIAPHEMRSPLPYDPRSLASVRTHLLLRGDVTAPGPAVDPGWPIVFGPTPGEMEKPRAVLADWIASPDNPLTARVWANRVWQWHFGRGFVETWVTSGSKGASRSDPRFDPGGRRRTRSSAGRALADRFGLENAALAVLNSSEFLYVP